MKNLLVASVFAVLSLSTLVAQDVVSAGQITTFSKDTGILTLVPEDRAVTPLVFLNMDRAPIMFSTGAVGTVSDLQPGRGATIHYRTAGQQLIVSKIVLSAPTPVPVPVVPAVDELPKVEQRALQGKAANDGDITTQPGAKARIDRDITTQPGKKDAIDRDITKKPADGANQDGDRTTKKDPR